MLVGHPAGDWGRQVTTDATVRGDVEPGFEPVAESFALGLEEGELGAAVSAYVEGHNVVDLWGGWADANRTREWERDTLVPTYSATKGMTATCAHLLVDRGVLDVDEPVATYWPEFAQAGKDRITVRMVLSHQAGLKRVTALEGGSSVVTSGMAIAPEKRFDWATIADALARSAPAWEPGTRWEYHGPTFGYLVGEIVRRVDGRELDVFFREEIADPLRADFMIAVEPQDDHRCAEAVGDEGMGAVPPVGDPWMQNGQFVWVNVNSRVWRGAADGASTGLGSADGLARVYAALANGGELEGVRLLGAKTIEAAAREQSLAHADGTTDEFGLGYALMWKTNPEVPAGAFGHPGAGGSLGLADPTERLSFGYVMNQMGSNGAKHLLRALYRSLAV
jgi:CubicO group peptidase (beta-lactamase class C family)